MYMSMARATAQWKRFIMLSELGGFRSQCPGQGAFLREVPSILKLPSPVIPNKVSLFA